MAVERILKHKDVNRGGMVTTEYLLPLEDSDVKGFPAWFRQFVACSPKEVLKKLAEQWKRVGAPLKPLVKLLMNHQPRSIAKLPGPRLFALILAGDHSFHYLHAPTSGTRCAFDNDFNQLLQHFAGLRLGREMPPPNGDFWPDEGFERFPQVVSETSDTVEPNYWGETGDWELSYEFYGVNSGKSFLFRRDGVIGQWTPMPRKGGTYREVFSSLSEFIDAYVCHAVAPNGQSPFRT